MRVVLILIFCVAAGCSAGVHQAANAPGEPVSHSDVTTHRPPVGIRETVEVLSTRAYPWGSLEGGESQVFLRLLALHERGYCGTSAKELNLLQREMNNPGQDTVCRLAIASILVNEGRLEGQAFLQSVLKNVKRSQIDDLTDAIIFRAHSDRAEPSGFFDQWRGQMLIDIIQLPGMIAPLYSRQDVTKMASARQMLATSLANLEKAQNDDEGWPLCRPLERICREFTVRRYKPALPAILNLIRQNPRELSPIRAAATIDAPKAEDTMLETLIEDTDTARFDRAYVIWILREHGGNANKYLSGTEKVEGGCVGSIRQEQLNVLCELKSRKALDRLKAANRKIVGVEEAISRLETLVLRSQTATSGATPD